ncbi:acyl-CoA reductase-like NAD-dependent aldehyde dehydrogenase [Sinorhizobium fredii]
MSLHQEFDRLSGTLYVDGTYLKSQSSERISVIDPATEDRLAEIANARGNRS